MKTRILLPALLALGLTSCASHERAITQPALNQIRPGVTTEADLVQLFGPPETKSTVYNLGLTHLDWSRSLGPSPAGYLPIAGQFLGGLDLEVQQLSVVIGPRGRVVSYGVYDSNGAVKTEKVSTYRETGFHK